MAILTEFLRDLDRCRHGHLRPFAVVAEDEARQDAECGTAGRIVGLAADRGLGGEFGP